MDYLLPAFALLAMLTVLAAGWLLTLFCLPGNWLIVLAAVVYAWLVPSDWRVDVGWLAVGVVVALAVIGELVELLAVTVGTSRAGGSKRAAFLALLGSVGGGVVGALIGIPIPVVGSVIGVLLFASAGAAAGAMIGESWKGRTSDEGWEVGKAAFWGRLLGTFAKAVTASVMVAVVLAALISR